MWFVLQMFIGCWGLWERAALWETARSLEVLSSEGTAFFWSEFSQGQGVIIAGAWPGLCGFLSSHAISCCRGHSAVIPSTTEPSPEAKPMGVIWSWMLSLQNCKINKAVFVFVFSFIKLPSLRNFIQPGQQQQITTVNFCCVTSHRVCVNFLRRLRIIKESNAVSCMKRQDAEDQEIRSGREGVSNNYSEA